MIRRLVAVATGYAVMALSVTSPVSVMLTSPQDGSVISNTVTLSVNASSLAGPISKVEYYLDGVLIATVTNPIAPPDLSLSVQTQ